MSSGAPLGGYGKEVITSGTLSSSTALKVLPPSVGVGNNPIQTHGKARYIKISNKSLGTDCICWATGLVDDTTAPVFTASAMGAATQGDGSPVFPSSHEIIKLEGNRSLWLLASASLSYSTTEYIGERDV